MALAAVLFLQEHRSCVTLFKPQLNSFNSTHFVLTVPVVRFLLIQKQVITMFNVPTHELPVPLVHYLDAVAAQRPGWTAARILSHARAENRSQNGVQDWAVSQVYLQSMFGELFVSASDDAQGELS